MRYRGNNIWQDERTDGTTEQRKNIMHVEQQRHKKQYTNQQKNVSYKIEK